MRDYTKSKYTKTAKITPEHHNALNEIRGKKSIAGKLAEIITYYLKDKRLAGIIKKK